MAARSSAGSLPSPLRTSVHLLNAVAAAAAATPASQPVMPNSVASSPAAAISPKRFAARSIWPADPTSTFCLTKSSIALRTPPPASHRASNSLTNSGPATP
jgi:hypothetical protein